LLGVARLQLWRVTGPFGVVTGGICMPPYVNIGGSGVRWPHFIWKLRCERRISMGDSPEAQHTTHEIHNRWLRVINNKLTMERLLTDRRRYGKKALSVQAVTQTWDEVLLDRMNLPNNWTKQAGVLVGIRPLRPPGRNR
jgi:hypothetical protein